MQVTQAIERKLIEVFAPERLDIVNESDRHAGHAGSPGTGESHFHVTIVSEKFTGLNRVARHRLVNDALAQELAGPVHALAIKALAPGE